MQMSLVSCQLNNVYMRNKGSGEMGQMPSLT